MYEKILSAYVTNLGKYTEGELVGKWLDFPTTQKEINKVLHEIGIDGIRYEEIFITDYEAYGRDVRLEEGGIYTHNAVYGICRQAKLINQCILCYILFVKCIIKGLI